jgi:hypothetical protein
MRVGITADGEQQGMAAADARVLVVAVAGPRADVGVVTEEAAQDVAGVCDAAVFVKERLAAATAAGMGGIARQGPVVHLVPEDGAGNSDSNCRSHLTLLR